MDLSNDADQTLVIIGNGMVSYKLCQRMVEYNAVDDKRIVVFGEEPRPAYDRVHLTELLSGTPSTSLLLAPEDWYAHNGIELFLDDPVVEIDRESSIVRSKSGRTVAYNRLVFATGSQPFVPPVDVISSDGEALPGVFVYRTIDDVYDIEDRADELLGTPFQEAAVIGGGLLGLEAAKAIYDLGLNVHVIEAAPWLMARQLDADGAAVLREKIERLEIKVHCGKKLKEVEALPFHLPDSGDLVGLRLSFDEGDPLMVGMIVFASGVRPRGEIAAAAGLSTNEIGGIVVDDKLHAIDARTGQRDEQIHAIGECAAHRGNVYGIVVPGYQMVDVLAGNLVGGDQLFEGADTSVKLKLMGVTVATLGEYDGDKRLGGNAVVFNGGGLYRKLVVRNGRLIGAVTVGDWDNLERIRELLKSNLPLSFWDMRRFRGTGDLWAKAESPPVTEWPPEAVVCGCLRVTRGAIGQVIAEGCASVEDVCARTTAGTLCGSCKPLIADLLGLEAPGSTYLGDAPSSPRGDAPPMSRRDGLRSRREASASRPRADLLGLSTREPVATQRTGTSGTGRFESLRATLLSSALATAQDLPDDEPAPMSVRARAMRETEPAPPLEPAPAPAPRNDPSTVSALSAVLRSKSSPAPDVKPSPRSLAVLAALHGDFSYGTDEGVARKEDPRKTEPPRKEEPRPSAPATAPATPRTGTVPPPASNVESSRRDEMVNSSAQLQAALPLLTSGQLPLPPDAAISTLTPAAGMVLGPALRAYATSAAKVAEMDSSVSKVPPEYTPTPPTGVSLSQLLGNKMTPRKAESTPPTGVAVVARAAPPSAKKSDPDAPARTSKTPPTGIPATQQSKRREGTLLTADAGAPSTPTSNVTVVDTGPQAPLSKRAPAAVRVVNAEPMTTGKTPTSGMMLDKAQSANAYAHLSFPKTPPTGFEQAPDVIPKRPSDRAPAERRTPTSGGGDFAPASVRSRALQNRSSSMGHGDVRSSDPGNAASSDRAPNSVRRPGEETSTAGGSEFPAERSQSRSRVSLIGAVDEKEILEVLGRDSLIPPADRAPMSRKTWVPPKNLSNPPGTLTTSSQPPPRQAMPSTLPSERGRKALLVASIVAVSWSLVLVFAPPIPPARSVRAGAVLDALTRSEGTWKHVSGYLLVAVCVLSLGISLRKRWKRFQFADVAFFRAVHAIITAASLVLFFAHTGFRTGYGFNFVLTIAFLTAIIVGAIAGAVFSLSDRWSALAARDRRLRAAWVHVLLIWPLPILIALHVLMVYYY